jgi:Ca2+-binding EF-hand superfamily protein
MSMLQRLAACATVLAVTTGCGTLAGTKSNPIIPQPTSQMSSKSVASTVEAGIRKKLDLLFISKDKDKDNFLSDPELPSNPVLPIIIGRPDQDDPENRAAFKKALDKNADGKVSKLEFKDPDFVAELVNIQMDQDIQMFRMMDENGDGFLTIKETAVADAGNDETGGMSEGDFKAMDTNKDGKLTLVEFETGMANPAINPLPI